MISCLMVTQESRAKALRLAVNDFVRQTFKDKELIIVHDGSEAFHKEMEGLLTRYPDQQITVHRVAETLSLGALRNCSVELANGSIVCQWDDDDRYHSQRLELQHQTLQDDDADFCFFTDQLHYFTQSRELFWDDWNIETYPMNLIQGSLMGSKDQLPLYPSIAKGEDTPVVKEIVAQGARVTQLSGLGYLYLYQYTGENTWGFHHHGAISSLKRYRRDRLEGVLDVIKSALGDYGVESFELKGQPILLPTDDGNIQLNLSL